MPGIINPSFLNGEVISLKELSFHIIDYFNAHSLKEARKVKLFYDRSDLRNIFFYDTKKESSPCIYTQGQRTIIDESYEPEYEKHSYQLQKCFYFIKGLIVQRENVALFKIPHDEFLSEDSIAKNRLKDFDRISFAEKALLAYFVHKGETDNCSLYFSFNIMNYVDPKNSLCLSLVHKNKILIASQKLIAFLKSKYGENYQLMRKEIMHEVDGLFSKNAGFVFSKDDKTALIINASSNQDESVIEEKIEKSIIESA